MTTHRQANTRQSLCRVCNNNCGILVETADGRVEKVTGDPSHPVSAGYTCVKGRSQPALLNAPDRLLHSQKRVDGELVPIGVETAMDEIARELSRIIDSSGPRAVASYWGTFITANHVTLPLIDSFMAGIGSPMSFTPIPIDKPGKQIARALHGMWQAPAQGFDRPDVCLLIGANPPLTYTGMPYGNPLRWLRDQTAGGMRLLVIDPRETVVARRAFVHLQPRPGHDPAILAAMVRVILDESRHDAPFLNAHARGVAELRRAVASFEPAVVARHADVDADDIVTAARVWADSPRGYAFAGTGPSMSSSSTLAEYLVLLLTTVTGKWLREGELVRNPRTLLPGLAARAAVRSPYPAYGFGEQMRVRGLSESAAGMPTAALPDEILMPGPGQVRALISCAGNPAAAFPDQRKTVAALRSLDLLVQIDPWLSHTARLAHYVIAPKLALETAGVSLTYDYDAPIGVAGGPVDAAAQYAPVVVDPPAGSEVIDEWEFYYGVARRLGITLSMGDGLLIGAREHRVVDMVDKPTTDDLLELLCAGSRVRLSEVKRHPTAARFPEPEVRVAPAEPGDTGRFELAAPEMVADLATIAERLRRDPAAPSLQLICRRTNHVRNSSLNVPATNGGRGYNPAFLHPDDLVRLGLRNGDVVDIESDRGVIPAIVAADETLRSGLVSMAHSYGGTLEEDGAFATLGSNTSRLIADDRGVERYSGQPRMSAVDVRIARRSAG